MIELTYHQSGARVAVSVSEIAAVMEFSNGSRIILKSGVMFDVVELFDTIGGRPEWKIQ